MAFTTITTGGNPEIYILLEIDRIYRKNHCVILNFAWLQKTSKINKIFQQSLFGPFFAKFAHFLEISKGRKCTKKEPFQALFKWRRRWDSNPRYAWTYDSFQDCSNQPLWHSSIRLFGCNSIVHNQTLLSTADFRGWYRILH